MLYTNYDKFAKRIGILNEKQLKKVGWPNVDNANRICTSRLEELKQFVDMLNGNSRRFIDNDKKMYHIATEIDAGELEENYCVEHGIKDDEERRVVGTCICNNIAYVNRMDYYLCKGDANEELFLEEVEEL